MSEKAAKAKRKAEKVEEPQVPEDMGTHLFDLTISIYDTGKFTMYAPKGASIPLALDCAMRATHRLWSMVVKRFSQPPPDQPRIVPGRMADIDILQEIKRQQGGRG
jgi:hypothetical protein